MLSPKKVKWRRQHRGSYGGYSYRGSHLNFGDYALAVTQAGRISARQIEAGRIAISRSGETRWKHVGENFSGSSHY